MIHLIKTANHYRVIDISPNGEVIKISHNAGFTTRKAAYKNIRATAKLYDAKIGYELPVQDDTGTVSKILIVTETRILPSDHKTGKPYRPGKWKLSKK